MFYNTTQGYQIMCFQLTFFPHTASVVFPSRTLLIHIRSIFLLSDYGDRCPAWNLGTVIDFYVCSSLQVNMLVRRIAQTHHLAHEFGMRRMSAAIDATFCLSALL